MKAFEKGWIEKYGYHPDDREEKYCYFRFEKKDWQIVFPSYCTICIELKKEDIKYEICDICGHVYTNTCECVCHSLVREKLLSKFEEFVEMLKKEYKKAWNKELNLDEYYGGIKDD